MCLRITQYEHHWFCHHVWWIRVNTKHGQSLEISCQDQFQKKWDLWNDKVRTILLVYFLLFSKWQIPLAFREMYPTERLAQQMIILIIQEEFPNCPILGSHRLGTTRYKLKEVPLSEISLFFHCSFIPKIPSILMAVLES